MIGIYKIRNTINNKYYIGSSKNIKKRFNKHKYQLKKGTHHCIYLQRAYKKYGSSVFDFEIYKLFDTIEKAIVIEQHMINMKYCIIQVKWLEEEILLHIILTTPKYVIK